MQIYAVKIVDISYELIDELCYHFSQERKIYISKFIDKQDKIRTIFGEVLVRLLACEILDISNKSIIFDKNSYGKPYINKIPKFCFNISHAGDYVLCAVSGSSVGIDIEKINDIDFYNIAQNYFADNEFRYIVNVDEKYQLSRFYEIWTLKESYLKCVGSGLSKDLDSFTIDCCGEKTDLIIDNQRKNYNFKSFDFAEEYKVAICSKQEALPNDIIKLDGDELIDRYTRLC